MSLTVVIADDHPLFREGLKEGLKRAGILVLGEATTGEEALSLTRRLRPDVLLLDIRLPDSSGLAVLKRLSSERRRPKVLILSAYETREYVRAAVRAGANGYLRKEASARELVDAVHAVARGRPYFEGTAARGLLEQMTSGPAGLPEKELTPREAQVLAAVADGLSNKETAASLGIGVRTVEAHRATLIEKLGVRGTAGLTRYALESGLVLPVREAADGGGRPARRRKSPPRRS